MFAATAICGEFEPLFGTREMSFQMDRHDAPANCAMVENRQTAETIRLLKEEFP